MSALDQPVAAVRQFNRFYTKTIGVLNESYFGTPFSLTEVRVLYELAHGERPTATELGGALDLDAGYLSRMLRRFEKQGLIAREAAVDDGRRSHLSLTKRGQKAFAALNDRSSDEIRDLLAPLSVAGRTRLLDAMHTIQATLAPAATAAPAYQLRPPRAGDMGWIVYRHGALYAAEYSLDARFEALVARIVADFVEKRDPARERCWIAERNGEVVGSIFLMKKSATVAKLRLLYVEPSARGLGIGRKLVDECVATARRLGYKKMTLWTQSNLNAARRIYEQVGFKRVSTERHTMFGSPQVAETWELKLSSRTRAARVGI